MNCLRIVPATYEIRAIGAYLVRECNECGKTETLVSTSPEYFRHVLEMERDQIESYPSGMIIELLDKCDIQCPTCIAGSSPLLGNLRSPAVIDKRISSIDQRQNLDGIFLSGGEPTIHPELFEFMDVVDSHDISRKVLITNGLRLATDEIFRDALLLKLSNGWEVFLQFDVLDAEILIDIRGSDFVEEHLRAVEGLGSANIPTTLVAVAKRGVSLERINETIAFAESRAWIRGVQIQPIRESGRLENYSSLENTCLASDVHQVLEAAYPTIKLLPYPASPLSVSLAYATRVQGKFDWSAGPRKMPDGMYIEPTNEPHSDFRVSVMEYSDDHNWSSIRQSRSPLCVLQSNGRTKRVDDHWGSVGIDLGPLRVK